MKSKGELNSLKEEVETLNKKLAELTDEELAEVSGCLAPASNYDRTIGYPGTRHRPGQKTSLNE